MKMENLKRLLLLILTIGILGWLVYRTFVTSHGADDIIHVAFIGPLSGNNSGEGKSLVNGIKLYLDVINRRGGVAGKKIILDEYDDQNTPSIASEKALEIAQKGQAVAVVGHFTSACSMEGGKIYKQYGIPVITPGATSADVTLNNEWYFRTTFNDNRQGRFLANFIKKVLNQDTVTIIHEDQIYGRYLAQVFGETAKQVNLTIKNNIEFQVKNEDLEEYLSKIVQDFKQSKETGYIFLATQAAEGAKIIKLIKDLGVTNPVIAPAALASKSFLDRFEEYPKEKIQPGYYTDGIYITTPLIFDTANEKAQQFKVDYEERYNEEADIRAAFGYDTIMVILDAVRNAKVDGSVQSLKDDRKKIRDYISKINNSSDAIEGVTGLNYFDENGDAQKSVSIGMFRNKNIISALIQLQDVRNPNEIINLDGATENERVLSIDGRYMYKTNVVYVGVKVNEINELDFHNLNYLLDFYLWFRFQGDINPQRVEFLNAVEPFELKETLSVENVNQMTHRLYRIKEHFKADFLPKYRSYNQHVIGFNFRHRELTRKNLIYVTDVLGMGTSDKEPLAEKLRKSQVISPMLNWSIRKALLFQDIIKENSLGSLRFLNVSDGKVEYSRFNLGILIANSEFTMRRILSLEHSKNLTILSAVFIIMLIFLSKNQTFRHFSKSIWIVQSIFTFSLLLASEIVILDWLSEKTQITISGLEVVITTFDVLWWMIPAILLNLATELFLWTPLEEKSGRAIPRIARRFVSSTVYIMTFFAIVAFVYDQRLTSLLATSGVIAMIIGLAVQINISNIFSGIAINMEHPFRVGDWVKIGNFEEGKVVDVTWRTTRIITRMGCILSIPNSTAAESIIHNFDYPDNTYWLKLVIHVHPVHPPERVQKIIMDAMMSSEVVVKTPQSYAIFLGLSEWAADYCVYFPVKDYAWRLLHEESVWKRIWIHLNRAGIAPAIQRQEIHLFHGVQERGEEAATQPITLLQEVDIFRPFSLEAKQYLSERVHRHRVRVNEVIVRQGDVGNSLFIIVEGVVGIRAQSKEKAGESIEVARLGAGNFFGEMALLTGEERTATVIALTSTYLYEITKEDIAALMAEQPEVSELISRILTQRQIMTQSQLAIKPEIKVEEEAAYKKLLNKIQFFFGLEDSPPSK